LFIVQFKYCKLENKFYCYRDGIYYNFNNKKNIELIPDGFYFANITIHNNQKTFIPIAPIIETRTVVKKDKVYKESFIKGTDRVISSTLKPSKTQLRYFIENFVLYEQKIITSDLFCHTERKKMYSVQELIKKQDFLIQLLCKYEIENIEIYFKYILELYKHKKMLQNFEEKGYYYQQILKGFKKQSSLIKQEQNIKRTIEKLTKNVHIKKEKINSLLKRHNGYIKQLECTYYTVQYTKNKLVKIAEDGTYEVLKLTGAYTYQIAQETVKHQTIQLLIDIITEKYNIETNIKTLKNKLLEIEEKKNIKNFLSKPLFSIFNRYFFEWVKSKHPTITEPEDITLLSVFGNYYL